MSNRHPYEVVTVSGMEAEAAWRQLRARGKGSPLIIGGDDELDYFGHLVSADRANDVRWNADERLDAGLKT
jgi:hypothetical protein